MQIAKGPGAIVPVVTLGLLPIAGRASGSTGTSTVICRRQGWLRMAQRLGPLVRGFLFAPEDHRHAAFRIELDHHVRALVRDPNVVILVDLHGVCERPGIQMMADLANEFAVGAELEKLC